MPLTDTATAPAEREPSRKVGLYAQKALPEYHDSPATRIPVQTLPFLAAATGLLVVPSALAGLALAQQQVATLQASLGDQWQHSAALVRELIDLEAARGLAAAAGLACFLLAAGLAAATKTLRRHRLDDHQGRYRAWGWISTLFVAAACSVVIPLDRLTATLMVEATGWPLAAGGRGWWMLLVGLVWLPFGLWAVLPLTQRFATAFWLAGSLAAWLTTEAIAQSLAAGWQPADWQLGQASLWHLVAAILHTFVPSLAAIGMLVASRSVIREARGLNAARRLRPQRRAARPRKQPPAAAPVTEPDIPLTSASDQDDLEEPAAGDEQAYEDDTWDNAPAEPPEAPPITASTAPQLLESGDSIDDTTNDHRLSKAERRRLRKQARKNRAA